MNKCLPACACMIPSNIIKIIELASRFAFLFPKRINLNAPRGGANNRRVFMPGLSDSGSIADVSIAWPSLEQRVGEIVPSQLEYHEMNKCSRHISKKDKIFSRENRLTDWSSWHIYQIYLNLSVVREPTHVILSTPLPMQNSTEEQHESSYQRNF